MAFTCGVSGSNDLSQMTARGYDSREPVVGSPFWVRRGSWLPLRSILSKFQELFSGSTFAHPITRILDLISGQFDYLDF